MEAPGAKAGLRDSAQKNKAVKMADRQQRVRGKQVCDTIAHGWHGDEQQLSSAIMRLKHTLLWDVPLLLLPCRGLA